MIRRLGVASNAGGASSIPGPGEASISGRGLVQPGATHTYQVWYRNPAPGFCTSAAYNWTQGVQVVWGT